MNYQQQLEDFAINRASKMFGELDADTIQSIKSNTAITQRVGMYLAGSSERAPINLEKLDELLKTTCGMSV